MKTTYKFIHFTELTDEVWWCVNNKVRNGIGSAEFYKPWKQWCFTPDGNTIFSHDCLTDIADFLKQLNELKTTAH